MPLSHPSLPPTPPRRCRQRGAPAPTRLEVHHRRGHSGSTPASCRPLRLFPHSRSRLPPSFPSTPSCRAPATRWRMRSSSAMAPYSRLILRGTLPRRSRRLLCCPVLHASTPMDPLFLSHSPQFDISARSLSAILLCATGTCCTRNARRLWTAAQYRAPKNLEAITDSIQCAFNNFAGNLFSWWTRKMNLA